MQLTLPADLFLLLFPYKLLHYHSISWVYSMSINVSKLWFGISTWAGNSKRYHFTNVTNRQIINISKSLYRLLLDGTLFFFNICLLSRPVIKLISIDKVIRAKMLSTWFIDTVNLETEIRLFKQSAALLESNKVNCGKWMDWLTMSGVSREVIICYVFKILKSFVTFLWRHVHMKNHFRN